jgi:hypothetical protein
MSMKRIRGRQYVVCVFIQKEKIGLSWPSHMSLALPLKGKVDIWPDTYQYPRNGVMRGGLHHDPFL